MSATAVRQLQGEIKIVGPDKSPRDRFCAQLFQAAVQKIAEKTGGRMPTGIMFAFKWPDRKEADVFIAAANGDDAGVLQISVYNEIMSAYENAAQAVQEGSTVNDMQNAKEGPGDTDDDDDDDEDEDEVEE